MRKSFPRQRFGLRDFVLMVRKDEVFSAGMQIEGFAQFHHRHDRTLKMPARAAGTDCTVPRSLAGLRRLPECKVAGTVFVVFVDVDTGAVDHTSEIPLRKLPVFGKLCDAEIVGAVVGAVCEPSLYQLGDELRHLCNVLGCFHQSRLLDPDQGCVFEKRLLVFGCVLLNAYSLARGIANDLVIHVGDVHDVTNPESTLPQKTAQDVDRDEGAEVADVSVVVDGRPAGVHADFVTAEREQFLNPRGHGVVETKRHSVSELLRRTYDSRG